MFRPPNKRFVARASDKESAFAFFEGRFNRNKPLTRSLLYEKAFEQQCRSKALIRNKNGCVFRK